MDAVWGTVWPVVPPDCVIGPAMWPARAYLSPRQGAIKAHSAHHPPDGVPIHSPLAPTDSDRFFVRLTLMEHLHKISLQVRG
jgi:hypothetical protein